VRARRTGIAVARHRRRGGQGLDGLGCTGFRAEERRRREADAAFFLPVAGEPAGGNVEHQRDVGEHHDEREEAEAVAPEAPPREGPDARLSHLSCTRGSIALYKRSATRLTTMVAIAT